MTTSERAGGIPHEGCPYLGVYLPDWDAWWCNKCGSGEDLSGVAATDESSTSGPETTS